MRLEADVLPSFRLMATTFLCGFALVYAGLRLVAPGMALGTEPAGLTGVTVQRTAAGLAEWRQAEQSLPAIFDLRFAPGEMPAVPVPASIADHAAERAAEVAPAPMPLPDLVPAADPPAAPASATFDGDLPATLAAPTILALLRPQADTPAWLAHDTTHAPQVEPDATAMLDDPAPLPPLAKVARTERPVRTAPARLPPPPRAQPPQRTAAPALMPTRPAAAQIPSPPTSLAEALFGRRPQR